MSVLIPERYTVEAETCTYVVYRGQVKTSKNVLANNLLFVKVAKKIADSTDETAETRSKSHEDNGDDEEEDEGEEEVHCPNDGRCLPIEIFRGHHIIDTVCIVGVPIKCICCVSDLTLYYKMNLYQVLVGVFPNTSIHHGIINFFLVLSVFIMNTNKHYHM